MSAGSSTAGSPPAAGGQSKPVTYDAMKSWSLWDNLNTAAQDSKAMTLDEVFADSEAKAYKDGSDNTVFNLQGTGRLDTDWDVSSANAFLDDLDPKSGKGWYLPVSGSSPVEKFGTSPTGAESGAYGHFVVVGWAGRVDGVQGSTLGIDTISPSSSVQQAGKQFLFHRNIARN